MKLFETFVCCLVSHFGSPPHYNFECFDRLTKRVKLTVSLKFFDRIRQSILRAMLTGN